MSHTRRVTLGVFLVGVVALAWSSHRPVYLQDHGRWEYCTLRPGGLTDQDTAEARIDYLILGDRGYRTEVVTARRTWDSLDSLNDNLVDNAFRRAMAKLGADGWEMVSLIPSDRSGANPWMVYFKRRQP
jgi:hypothetical protein